MVEKDVLPPFHDVHDKCLSLYRATRPQNLRKYSHMGKFIVAVGKAMGDRGATVFQENLPALTKVNRLTGRHLPDKIPATDKKAQPTRTCRVCSDITKATTGLEKWKERNFLVVLDYLLSTNIPVQHLKGLVVRLDMIVLSLHHWNFQLSSDKNLKIFYFLKKKQFVLC